MSTARSPLSGCAIFIAAALMLLFLIGFSIWTPFRQAAEMEKFTRDQAEPLAIESTAERAGDLNALRQRLDDFNQQLASPDGEARLELDADDLNLGIAAFPALEELRGSFRVREIVDGALVIDICYQLNGRPRLTRDDEEGFVTADPRYLVGTIRGAPMLSRRELALRVNELIVPGQEIPDGFMGHFSTLRLFEKSLKDPQIGPAMARLTRASIDGDKLVLARIPGETPPDVVSRDSFERSGGKLMVFLGGAILVFLLVAGSLLFLGYRAQLKKLQAGEQTNDTRSDA